MFNILNPSKIEIKNTEEFELYYRNRIYLYDSNKIIFNLSFFLHSNSYNAFLDKNINNYVIKILKDNLHREFFINDSAEPIFPYINNIFKFLEICKSYNKSVTIITGQNTKNILDLYKSFGLNVVFLPLYNFFNHNKHNSYSTFYKENKLTKRFLTLNKGAKPIRKLLYNFLKINDLLKFGEYSFLFENVSSFNEKIDKNDNSVFETSIINKFEFNKKCFLNFVVETANEDYFIFEGKNIKYNFVSEKTVKALYTGLPFIIIGEPNLLNCLKSYGIKTFDAFWDESYDNENDINDRTSKAFNILKNICFEKESVVKEIYYETEQIHKQNTLLIDSIIQDNLNTLKYKVNLL